MDEKQLRRIFIMFICGIVLVLFAPFIFTRSAGLINFKDTGTIGDTIGGITAPITSLIGSILVFYALKAQIEANRLIQFQFQQEKFDEIERKKLLYLAEQISLIRDDINDFSYTIQGEHLHSGETTRYKFNYKGTDAIVEFIDNVKHYGEGHRDEDDPFKSNPKLIELFNLLQIINGLIDKVNIADIQTEDKTYFLSSIAYQFNSKIKPPFVANEKHRTRNTEPCKRCGKKHYGIPDKIFDLVDAISEKLK